jgi:hypothetical protein
VTKVAYRVTSPLKRDGRIIPVGGQAVFDSDDEEQVALATLGAIDGASGVHLPSDPQEGGEGGAIAPKAAPPTRKGAKS